jgi:hypothetical protein
MSSTITSTSSTQHLTRRSDNSNLDNTMLDALSIEEEGTGTKKNKNL